MKLSRNMKIILIVLVLAVAAYFAYRWWQNRQSSDTNSPTGSLGANLNSTAPLMVGGSSTGGSGLTYTAPATTIDLSLPNGAPSSVTDATETTAAQNPPKAPPPKKRPPPKKKPVKK